jgi:hypothetical protein
LAQHAQLVLPQRVVALLSSSNSSSSSSSSSSSARRVGLGLARACAQVLVGGARRLPSGSSTWAFFDSPSPHSDCKACSSLRRRAFASSSESESPSAHRGATFLTLLTRRGESSTAGRACRPVAHRRQSTRVATCSCIRVVSSKGRRRGPSFARSLGAVFRIHRTVRSVLKRSHPIR